MQKATVTRVARAVAFWVSAANLGAAALVWWQLEILTPPTPGSPAADIGAGPLEELVLAVALIGTNIVIIRRRIATVLAWLAESRSPTPAERDALLRQPGERAVVGQLGWILGGVLAVSYNIARHNVGPSTEHIRTFLGIALAGTVVSALSFIVTERVLKPTWAVALAAAPAERSRTIGVRPRLLLGWALGSAIPILGIGLALLRPDVTSLRELRPPLLFLVGAGLAAGGVLMIAAAKAVGEPLDELRRAVDRIARGDLDVAVPVDDGGEIGFLQAGFNRMAEGLRERQHLEDLFGRHVGIDVARRAVAGGATLGGEQREVTVLFVDLIGSSELGERMEPGRVVALLNEFFAAVVAEVTAQSGWVDKFEGDGAMCVWGAPEDQPDHAARGLRAARALGRRIAELRQRHPELDAGVGVSSGVVVAGNIGTEDRFEYTVIGHPVNEAARLTEVAKHQPERVVAAASAVERASEPEATAWHGAGETMLRGHPHPTRICLPVVTTADGGVAAT